MPSNSVDCIFCRIVRRDASASIVAEDADTLAFLDIRPLTPGHTLVVPKSHAASVEEFPAGGVGPILETAKRVASAMRRSGVPCEAVSLYLADGKAAGQEVFHVHMHVIPRFAGDGFGIRAGPDYGRQAGREELEAIAAKIRSAMPDH